MEEEEEEAAASVVIGAIGGIPATALAVMRGVGVGLECAPSLSRF